MYNTNNIEKDDNARPGRASLNAPAKHVLRIATL